MRRLARRIGVVGAASAALALACSAPAFAHATLEGTEPARGSIVETQPEAVVFHFSEAVEMNFSSVHIYDATGDVVDDGAPVHPDGVTSDVSIGFQPDIAHGTYTATYRVISADGHPVSGGFLFSVGEAGAAPTKTVAELSGGANAGCATTTAFAVARAVQYGAIALAIGGFVFLLCRGSAVYARSPGPGRVAGDVGGVRLPLRLRVRGRSRRRRGQRRGGIVFKARRRRAARCSTRSARPVVRQVLETHFGFVWGLGVLVWLPLGGRPARVPPQEDAGDAARDALERRTCAAAGVRDTRHLVVVLALLALLALSPAFAGHANAQDPTAILLPARPHVLAISVWVGGLVMLLFVLRGAMRCSTSSAGGACSQASSCASRRSPASASRSCSSTGIVQSFVYVRNLDNLLHTEYGQILLAKILRLRRDAGRRGLQPPVQRSAAERDRSGRRDAGAGRRHAPSGAPGRGALRGRVLGITGALAGFAPATATGKSGGPFAKTDMIGPAQIQLTVDPAQVGPNLMHLYLLDPETGAQWDRAQEVRVKLVQPEKQIELDVTTRKGGPGHYVVDAALFSADGTWDVQITARVSEFDEYAKTIEVPIGTP